MAKESDAWYIPTRTDYTIPDVIERAPESYQSTPYSTNFHVTNARVEIPNH